MNDCQFGRGSSRLAGSEQHAIGHRELRSPRLTPQHRELVPEHDDLQLLERLGATTKQHQLEQAAAHQTGARPEQEPAPRNQRDGPTTLRPTRTPKPRTELTHPSGRRRALLAPSVDRQRPDNPRRPGSAARVGEAHRPRVDVELRPGPIALRAAEAAGSGAEPSPVRASLRTRLAAARRTAR
jgi:hypothetical protein